ncbi:MAG TPA: MFS transporter [Candidatus Saccharimonadales bacterium]|nr:MFS transporter [Candidatus Saccharimonadales bacterium]
MKLKQKHLRYLLFVNLFSLAGYYTFAPLYALFAHGFVLSPKHISFIWGAYSLLTALFILLFGKYENAKRKGKLVVLGYIIYAIGALLFLTVHSETRLMLVLAFNALGAGVTLPAYKTLFARNERTGKESEQWSWLDAGNMFAAALGGALGGLLVGAYGFRGIFITMASIQAVAALIAYKSLYQLV